MTIGMVTSSSIAPSYILMSSQIPRKTYTTECWQRGTDFRKYFSLPCRGSGLIKGRQGIDDMPCLPFLILVTVW